MNKLICISLLACFILVSCNNNNATVPPAVKDDTAISTGKDTAISTAGDSVASPALPDTVAAARLVVPGKSIGLTYIKEATAALEKKLGKPDSEDAAMGKSMEIWYAKNTARYETDIYSTTNMGAANEASRVNQVRVTSPYFMTAEKLGVDAALTDIQKQYPKIKKTGSYTITKTGATNYIYDAINEGIAFEISSAGKCVGVAVHAPKEKAFETYLGFFEHYVPL